MKGILINFTIVLVSNLCLLASLEAGCMGEDEIMVLKNNGDYDCKSTISPQERIKREKERRKEYLRKMYLEEIENLDKSNIKTESPTPDNAQSINTYQGKKTWKEAKDYCEELGMRLPTKKELAYAFQSGQTKNWNSVVRSYWSDEENLTMKGYQSFIYTKNSVIAFSCIDKTFKLTVAKGEKIPLEFYLNLFSSYQGEMNWGQASKKCIAIGLRLPTIDELKDAYNEGITKSWQKDGLHYWSSTPYDAESYYGLNVDYGNTGNYRRYNDDYVRCRR